MIVDLKENKEFTDLQRTVLILMTRWPAKGRCKKRLSKEIGLNAAANIQDRLTKHTIQVAKSIVEEDFIDVYLSISGIGKRAANHWAKQMGIKNISVQGKGCLGLKMRREIIKLNANFPLNTSRGLKILIIGADLPTLSRLDLLEALQALDKSDLVIGPSEDGGYWLIGLSSKLIYPLVSWPFIGIPWGTEKVFKTTVERAKAKEIKYSILSLQNDLDRSEDLLKWCN